MDSLIDLLRARSICGLLGAQFTEVKGFGALSFPRVTATSAVSWSREGQAAPSGTSPSLIDATFTPITATAYINVSRRALMEQPALQYIAITDLMRAISTDVDRVALNGSGSGEPQGILQNSSCVTISLGTNGAAPTLAALCLCESTLNNANVPTQGCGWALSPNVQSILRRTEKVANTGRMLLPDDGKILGYRSECSNHIPQNLTKAGGSNLGALVFGAFEFLTIATWGVVDILVNPYLVTQTGYLRISAFLDCDVQARHTEAFVKIVDMVTT